MKKCDKKIKGQLNKQAEVDPNRKALLKTKRLLTFKTRIHTFVKNSKDYKAKNQNKINKKQMFFLFF